MGSVLQIKFYTPENQSRTVSSENRRRFQQVALIPKDFSVIIDTDPHFYLYMYSLMFYFRASVYSLHMR